MKITVSRFRQLIREELNHNEPPVDRTELKNLFNQIHQLTTQDRPNIALSPEASAFDRGYLAAMGIIASKIQQILKGQKVS